MLVPRRNMANALLVKCRWCGAAPGSRCTVRGMQRPLRNPLREYICHPTREEDLREEMQRRAEATATPGGEEVVMDAVDL